MPTAHTYGIYITQYDIQDLNILSFLYKELLSMDKLLVHGVSVQIDC